MSDGGGQDTAAAVAGPKHPRLDRPLLAFVVVCAALIGPFFPFEFTPLIDVDQTLAAVDVGDMYANSIYLTGIVDHTDPEAPVAWRWLAPVEMPFMLVSVRLPQGRADGFDDSQALDVGECTPETTL